MTQAGCKVFILPSVRAEIKRAHRCSQTYLLAQQYLAFRLGTFNGHLSDYPLNVLTFCIPSWEAPPSNSVTFVVPDNWKAGRIWVCLCFLLLS